MSWLTVILIVWMGSAGVLLFVFRGWFGESKKISGEIEMEPSIDDYWNDGWVSDQGDRTG